MATKTLYEILGVDKSATTEEIKKQYRKLAKTLHPDVQGTGNEAAFKEIGEAYDILSNKEKRDQYDFTGSTSSRTAPDAGFAGYTAQGFYRDANKPIVLNSNITIQINITAEESLRPVVKRVQYQRPICCPDCDGRGGKSFDKKVCPDCNGQGIRNHQINTPMGTMFAQDTCQKCNQKGYFYPDTCSMCQGTGVKYEMHQREITIPVGGIGRRCVVKDGGGVAIKSQPPGVLIVDVGLLPHSKFQFANDASVLYRLNIDPIEAILGNKIKVPTIDGNEIDVNIAEKSNNQNRISVKGRGLPLSPDARADMIVEIQYELPNQITDEMRQALQQYIAAKNKNK